jgi:uncharacterized protein YdhG (YjbR/CyaY superfamily)
MAVKYADAKRFALSLPGVYEELHFGMPSFRVNKRMLVTVPPGNMLHVFVADEERDMCLMVYASCTEKVLWGGKVVGIRIFLDKATRGAVEDLILRAWKYRASKKDVAAYEARQAPPAAVPPAQRAKTARKAAPKKSSQRSFDEKMGAVAPDVDAYVAGFPPEIRARLEKVRATIRKAAPQAVEGISYRIAGYTLEGALIYFAGFKHHIGVYPVPRASLEFRDELAAYKGGKGTVQFPHDKPLPLDLIRRIVKFRVADNLARAAARKAPKKGKAQVARKAPARARR